MWLKEQDGQLIPAPVNFRTPGGATIFNFNLNPDAMTEYGWRDWTEEEIAEWKRQHPDPVIPKTMCTKYELVTCLQKYFPELLANLRTAYAQSPDLQFYWNSVLDLDRNNADFRNLVQNLGVTSEQLDEIFSKIGA